MKILLWWCAGITAAGAYVVFAMRKREHREVRFARVLEPAHKAHDGLRDVAYQRYIARVSDHDWTKTLTLSLQEFASAFSVATGSKCHATIKQVSAIESRPDASPNDWLVDTFVRSSERTPALRPGVENTVGRNTDFRQLFRPDEHNRCWHNNDLLALTAPELYDNPHWPANPTRKNVPYRSTMVWPIRKVIREAAGDAAAELYIWGFLTIDSMEPGILDYDRHFELGAAYADHLLSVLWDPAELRKVHLSIAGEGDDAGETNDA